jgi:hypothetical protein
MSFEDSESQHAAINEAAGLKLERGNRFADTKTVILKLTDIRSGREWEFPVPTIQEALTHDTPNGPHTSTLDVGLRLQAHIHRPIVADLAARGRDGQPLSEAEAQELFEEALTVYFMRGGLMKKWVPSFRIEWA